MAAVRRVPSICCLPTLILAYLFVFNWNVYSSQPYSDLFFNAAPFCRFYSFRSLGFIHFYRRASIQQRRHLKLSVRGRTYLSSRISYYPNSSSFFHLTRIIRSGDISTNPGPDKCPVCNNTVAKNHRALSCDTCNQWCHIKCGKVKPREYKKLQLVDNFSWNCPACSPLPLTTPACLHHSFNFSPSIGRDKHSLDCIVLNARSLRNKLLDFQSVVYAGKFDIVTVSETWLDDTVFDHEILPTGYTIFRRGGGVLMAFKSDITAWRRNDLESDCELLWCEFTSSAGQKILFGSYYRPPNTGIEYFELLRESFTAINKFDKVFLAGDFNLINFDWINQVPLSSETIYWNAYELLNDAFLTQVNTYPTRNNSILDLVLTTVPDLIDDLYSYQDVVESDHNSISFRIGLSSTDSRPVLKGVFNYKKANFEELKRTLSYYQNQ
ncbi:uncharacterized protein [Montipora foliosa]|uniref:uncharacterized protein n=1 Tax=Montipora foliosa TaxID=591990 RepID=UPI0035F1680D